MNITNEDNMELMARYEDNYFDLAIVDPPYGIGISSNPVRQKHNKKKWDNNIPQKEYFNELFRVSKNQIVWGGNYFIENLYSSNSFVLWDKVFNELHSPWGSVNWERNYLNKYVQKNYETNLVFVKF